MRVLLLLCLLSLPVHAYEFHFDTPAIEIQKDDIEHVETFKIGQDYFLKVIFRDGYDTNFNYKNNFIQLYNDFDDVLEDLTYERGISWEEAYKIWNKGE